MLKSLRDKFKTKIQDAKTVLRKEGGLKEKQDAIEFHRQVMESIIRGEDGTAVPVS